MKSKWEDRDLALDSATSIDDVKLLRDQAETLRIYALKQLAGVDKHNEAAEYKLRCERKLGRLILEQVTPGGRRNRDALSGRMSGAERSLPDGVNAIQSFRWRRMAAVTEQGFESWIQTQKSMRRYIYSESFLRFAALKLG